MKHILTVYILKILPRMQIQQPYFVNTLETHFVIHRRPVRTKDTYDLEISLSMTKLNRY